MISIFILLKDSAWKKYFVVAVEFAITTYKERLGFSQKGTLAVRVLNDLFSDITWICLRSALFAVKIKDDLVAVFKWSNNDHLKLHCPLKERYCKS